MLRLDFRTICRNQTVLANPSRQPHSLPVAKTRNQSPSSGKGPVVYPWMKKVHVNAASFVPLLLVNPSYTGGEPKHSSTAYMRQQVLELEKEFHYNRYFTWRRKVEIAHSLCLSQHQIKIWFQNQGMKWKKDHKLPNTKI